MKPSSLILTLAASFVTLTHSSRVRRDPSEMFADTISELKGLMKTKLHEDKVIPEVIMEIPEQPVAVFYPLATVKMGNHIDPAALRYIPQFFFKWKPSSFYTVMLLGPDYPNREAPTERNRLMWCVTNFAQLNATYTIRPIGLVSYQQPQPRNNSGKMRYVFLVYEQPTNRDWSKNIIETPAPLTNFMPEWYVDRNGLNLVAVNYFVIETGQDGNQADSSVPNKSFGRVTGEETLAMNGNKANGTRGKNSNTREEKARVDEKTTENGKSVTRPGEKTGGPGEKEARSDEKSTGAAAMEAEEKTTSADRDSRPTSETATGTGEKQLRAEAKVAGAFENETLARKKAKPVLVKMQPMITRRFQGLIKRKSAHSKHE